MSRQSCCRCRQRRAARSSDGFATPPCGWSSAATRCTSSRAITATARRRITIDGVHYHFVRIPESIDRGLPAAAIRGLWYYMRRGPLHRRHRTGRGPSSQPARGLVADRSCGGGRAAGDLAPQHGIRMGLRLSRLGPPAVSARARGGRARARASPTSSARTRSSATPPSRRRRAGSTTALTGARSNRGASSTAKAPQTILYVGRVEQRKGVHVLVDAFEHWIAARAADGAAAHCRAPLVLGSSCRRRITPSSRRDANRTRASSFADRPTSMTSSRRSIATPP